MLNVNILWKTNALWQIHFSRLPSLKAYCQLYFLIFSQCIPLVCYKYCFLGLYFTINMINVDWTSICLIMDYSITGHGTPMIFILEVGIPWPKLWCPKTDLSWIITNKITIFSKNSDQYLSFEGLHILLPIVEVGF